MGFNCGIVGLPNVGKSTIFNSLTAANAEAANYPFCTIEPNTGVVFVPDDRLDELAKIVSSKRKIPTTVEFVDIAGLVQGASKGEGLGNQFLSHIRSVDAIIHVVRCFQDEDISHVYGGINPVNDVDVIHTELLLADLASLENKINLVTKKAKSGHPEANKILELAEEAKDLLSSGVLLRNTNEGGHKFSSLQLLTTKPELFVANVEERFAAEDIENSSNNFLVELKNKANSVSASVIVLSGKIESEISELDVENKIEFLKAIGLQKSGLERLIFAGYNLLNLITFFTAGPEETRAWTCPLGVLAPNAGGVIHSDFERGFIKAEVISYSDFIACGGEQRARESGKLRIEGKTYEVSDGDVIHFRFNV